jgi:uncharacterized protein
LSIELILILIAIGIATGVLSGLFGVGGGIIIVPSLLAVYSFINFDSTYTVHIAIATSLFTIIFTSISSSYKHFKHGNVEWTAALIIGLVSSVSVYFFSLVAVRMPGQTLKGVFSVVLIVVALKMLLDRKKPETRDQIEAVPAINKFLAGAVGALSGAIAAFSGLGGGVFLVPLIHYLMKFPFKKAIGTSSAAILLTAAAGVISYFLNMPQGANELSYSFGMVDTLSALPIIAASIPFAQLGVYINKRTHSFLLTKLFAVFIIAVSLKLLFF